MDAWGAEGGAETLARDLGRDFAVLGANFKFLNAGYPIHTVVEAAMALIAECGLAIDATAGIEVGMADNARRVVDDRAMHTICVQDMLTASIVSGGLELLDRPFPAIMRNPAFQVLREKITVSVDPEIQRELPDGRAARVTINTKNGPPLTKRIDFPRGHSRRGEPSWEDLAGKWRQSLPDCEIETALTLSKSMEELEDVTTLARAFSGVMR